MIPHLDSINFFLDSNRLDYIRMPNIIEAFESDPCDWTSPEEIRIKVGNEPSIFHALHVFGHWVADLHTDKRYCDDIATVLGQMVSTLKQIKFLVE